MSQHSKKIKILHLITDACRQSGPQQLVTSIVKKMDRDYFTNHVALIDCHEFTGTSLLEEELISEICIYQIPWNKKRLLINSMWRLQKIAKKEGFNILHCHDNRATLLGFLVGKKLRLPLIRSLHGYEHTPTNRVFYSFDMFLLNFFDCIIFGSSSMKNRFGRIHSKVFIVQNAINVDVAEEQKNSSEVREKYKINRNIKVICTVGRLSPEKGHTYLIQATKKVCEKLQNVKFIIVGEGPLKGQLEDLTHSLCLNGNIIFTGFVENIHEVLAISDIYVQSSIEESLPLTVLEAMAHRKPLISTDVGGINEAVVHGINGLLVPPKDPDQLSRAILNLLDNPTRMKAMGEAGQAIVRERFSDETMIERHQRCYESLVQESKL